MLIEKHKSHTASGHNEDLCCACVPACQARLVKQAGFPLNKRGLKGKFMVNHKELFVLEFIQIQNLILNL